MSQNKTTLTPVMGYLANNWPGLNAHTPAVVMNPEARPLDLLAWCWGELQSMQAAADAMASGDDYINKGDFSALIVHRINPLLTVFETAVVQLHGEAVKQSGRL